MLRVSSGARFQLPEETERFLKTCIDRAEKSKSEERCPCEPDANWCPYLNFLAKHRSRLINTWRQPGADESNATSRFNGFRSATRFGTKPFKRLNLSCTTNTGLKPGVNETRSASRLLCGCQRLLDASSNPPAVYESLFNTSGEATCDEAVLVVSINL